MRMGGLTEDPYTLGSHINTGSTKERTQAMYFEDKSKRLHDEPSVMYMTDASSLHQYYRMYLHLTVWLCI
jgi:hypothetical protein